MQVRVVMTVAVVLGICLTSTAGGAEGVTADVLLKGATIFDGSGGAL